MYSHPGKCPKLHATGSKQLLLFWLHASSLCYLLKDDQLLYQGWRLPQVTPLLSKN